MREADTRGVCKVLVSEGTPIRDSEQGTGKEDDRVREGKDRGSVGTGNVGTGLTILKRRR